MIVHHVPGSRSCRVLWLLEELGIDYQVERRSIADGSLRTDEYRALNPLGRVPTLEVPSESLAFYESGAIVQWILERYGDGRLEPEIQSRDRGAYLQWFHWGEATLLPPIATINSNRFVLRETDRSAKALDVARRQLRRVLGVLDSEVAGRPYLVGNEFTAADIMVGYGVQLASTVGELEEGPAGVRAWLATLAGRPAFEKAFAGGFG